MPRAARPKFYAVRRGHKPGIYSSWPDCSQQVVGFRGCEHKSFTNYEEAAEYLRAGNERYSYLAGEDSAHCDNMSSQKQQQQQQQQLSDPLPLSSFAHFGGHVSSTGAAAAAAAAAEEVGGGGGGAGTAPLTRTPHTGTSPAASAPSPATTAGGAIQGGGAKSPYFPTPSPSPTARLAGTQATAAASGAISAVDDGKAPQWYYLEFDGASKGNPGPAGAGAVVRDAKGQEVFTVKEGVGSSTNNVAEYRGLIAGLQESLKQGFTHVSVKGDSMLVVQQVQGYWQVKNEGLKPLCAEARQLVKKFQRCTLQQVDREYNQRADALSNQGVFLQERQRVVTISDHIFDSSTPDECPKTLLIPP